MKQTKGQIERNKTIVTRILNNEKMVDLAREYELTPTRIRSIFHESLRRLASVEGGRVRMYMVTSIPIARFREMKDIILEML